MATAKKTPARKSPAPTRDEDLDEIIDELPLAKPKTSAAPPGEDEQPDDFEMDGLAQGNRRTAELEAAMRARSTGKPKFPYPEELREVLKPYWLELVNCFPADHFQLSDVPMMKVYCRCAYDIERCSLMIEDEGEVVIGGRGAPMVNPRVKVRGDAQLMLLSISTKFRNQPASRVNSNEGKIRGAKAITANKAADAIEEDDLLAGSRMH